VNIRLLHSNKKVFPFSVELVSSKSESNRVLMIQALCKEVFSIENLSMAEDTVVLKHLLENKNKEKNCGQGGTTLRFLTAFFASTPCDVFLTGSHRMKERPVKILVDALCTLGANITYKEKEGFPPLHIVGKKLKGGTITIDSSVSSQYISALLLIAPTLENGLEIKFSGKRVSVPYIQMTLEIMRHFGIEYSVSENTISINQQNYKAKNICIENDWTAASYWYSFVAIAEDAVIHIPNLKKNSLQGDADLSTIYKTFGVETTFLQTGISIKKNKNICLPEFFQCDFSDCPDLAQTVAVTCAALNIPALLTGLETLQIKETNRLEAVCKELDKFGATTKKKNNSLHITSGCKKHSKNVFINTYHDHRMAMAFAPLILLYPQIEIENDKVIDKSYPSFWNDLTKAGIEVLRV